jgi:hypothetical protein
MALFKKYEKEFRVITILKVPKALSVVKKKVRKNLSRSVGQG